MIKYVIYEVSLFTTTRSNSHVSQQNWISLVAITYIYLNSLLRDLLYLNNERRV